MQKYLGFALVLGLLLVAGKVYGEEKADAGKIEGSYSMVSMTMNGQEQNSDDLKQVSVLLKDGKYTVKFGQETVGEGTYKTSAKKKPYTIDSTSSKGGDEGKTRLGIYELKDGELKVCFAEPGKDRPADFTSKSGDGRIAYVMKRATK